jgi:hypothetical protein
MTFKDFFEREKHVALHAQSLRFRIAKYTVIAAIAAGVYFWKGLDAVGLLFLVLTIMALAVHFFFRWKTEAWTKPWGLYKRIRLNGE